MHLVEALHIRIKVLVDKCLWPVCPVCIPQVFGILGVLIQKGIIYKYNLCNRYSTNFSLLLECCPNNSPTFSRFNFIDIRAEFFFFFRTESSIFSPVYTFYAECGTQYTLAHNPQDGTYYSILHHSHDDNAGCGQLAEGKDDDHGGKFEMK